MIRNKQRTRSVFFLIALVNTPFIISGSALASVNPYQQWGQRPFVQHRAVQPAPNWRHYPAVQPRWASRPNMRPAWAQHAPRPNRVWFAPNRPNWNRPPARTNQFQPRRAQGWRYNAPVWRHQQRQRPYRTYQQMRRPALILASNNPGAAHTPPMMPPAPTGPYRAQMAPPTPPARPDWAQRPMQAPQPPAWVRNPPAPPAWANKPPVAPEWTRRPPQPAPVPDWVKNPPYGYKPPAWVTNPPKPADERQKPVEK